MAGRLPPPAEGPLWFPHRARVGQGGQSAAAALHALGLPPLQERPALAELFAAHTPDGFAEREPGPPAPPARPQPARHARGRGVGPVLAAPAWEEPGRRAARPHADEGPTGRPAERAEREAGAASAAALGGGTHAAAACGDGGAGDGAPGARAAAAGGVRAAPRGPAALQRYNGLSAAEADALEHVFTGEGVRPWLRPCTGACQRVVHRVPSAPHLQVAGCEQLARACSAGLPCSPPHQPCAVRQTRSRSTRVSGRTARSGSSAVSGALPDSYLLFSTRSGSTQLHPEAHAPGVGYMWLQHVCHLRNLCA